MLWRRPYWVPDALLLRAAELLNSFPSTDLTYGSDTDVDSPMSDDPPPAPLQTPINRNAREAQLEAKELHKYLLAKTYFDCREFDQCAAIFLPGSSPKGSVTPVSPQASKISAGPAKGKAKATAPADLASSNSTLSNTSQKALFLALYARYMSGEKRKDENSEMILGPADGGVTVNKELNGVSGMLEQWLNERQASGGDGDGWLEYLYGVILAKSKNEELAKKWFVRSIHLYPYNWGAWQELANLLGTLEEVPAQHTFCGHHR